MPRERDGIPGASAAGYRKWACAVPRKIVGECRAYLALALRSLLDAWAASDSAQNDDATAPSERHEQALLALDRAKYPRIARLTAAYRAIVNEAPAVAHSAAALSERDLDWIGREVARLNRFSLHRFAPVETRRRFRNRLALVLVPSVLIAVMVFWLRARPKVVASASFADIYPPRQAVDRLEATEWLLPDGTNGWIDLVFKAPRRVRSVTLVNCHNGVYGDRGSGKVRVTAFENDKVVATAEGAFPNISTERSALDLPLDGKNVTRVRAEVLSVLGLGGGFAEVELD